MTFDLGSEEFHQPTDELGLITAAEFVLPNPDDHTVECAQRAIYATVAGPVGGDLVSPEGGVGLGLGRVPGAAVPEAAVHKHRGLALGLPGRQCFSVANQSPAAVASRAWYGSLVSGFLVSSGNEILGELTRHSEFSVDETQKEAWLEEIDRKSVV